MMLSKMKKCVIFSAMCLCFFILSSIAYAAPSYPSTIYTISAFGVSTYNGTTNTLNNNLPFGSNIGSYGTSCMSPDFTRAYVATTTGVRVYNTSTDTLITTLGSFGWRSGCNALACTPNGQYLYACDNDNNRILVFYTSNNTLKTVIYNNTGIGCRAIVFNGDGSKAYFSNYFYGNATIRRIDTATNVVDRVYVVGNTNDGYGGYQRMLDYNYKYDKIAFVHGAWGSPKLLDVNTGSIENLPSQTSGCAVRSLSFTPDGNKLYTGEWNGWSPGTGCISVYLIGNLTKKTTIWGFKEIEGTCVSPNGKYLYACAWIDGYLCVVDTDTDSIVTKIPAQYVVGGTNTGGCSKFAGCSGIPIPSCLPDLSIMNNDITFKKRVV